MYRFRVSCEDRLLIRVWYDSVIFVAEDNTVHQLEFLIIRCAHTIIPYWYFIHIFDDYLAYNALLQ